MTTKPLEEKKKKLSLNLVSSQNKKDSINLKLFSTEMDNKEIKYFGNWPSAHLTQNDARKK